MICDVSVYMMLVVTSLLVLLSVAVGQSAHKDPYYEPGRDTMVHLFEWKWKDIAKECEQFLGPMGYGGVQVSPIQENIIIDKRPWWERYQPISYLWTTRSGTKEDFVHMVQRCNKAGVRIYVDVVFNHMSGNHKNAIGTGGSKADTFNLDYHNVPYNKSHFNPQCEIYDYNNPENVRNCELVGLHDLNQANEHVRSKIVDFMNEVIDTGVAGFRIDAAKHMWPKDLKVIYSRLKNLNTEYGFPNNAPPFIFQEVIDYGSEGVSKYEYNDMAVVTEFKYGQEISNSLRGNNPLKWFATFGESWSLLPSKDALVFIDNHDTQRTPDSNILTYKSSKLYKMAVAFMLAHPYGIPRVMSSYSFHDFNDSPPADSAGNLLSPIIHPDNTCSNGWVCEHRWRQIYNMVRFRNVVNGTTMNNWWDNGGNQIAFGRGSAGMIVINADNFDLKVTLFTAMAPGNYCDVISGNIVNGKCTGKIIYVAKDGRSPIQISASEEDGVIAIHREAKLP